MKKKEFNKKNKNRGLKVFGIVVGILLLILIIGYFFLMTHTQIIVGFIQNVSKDQINTKNLYEPLNNLMYVL